MAKNYNPFLKRTRNNEEVTVGEAMKSMFKHMGLEDKMTSVSISNIWKEAMGPFIADRTKKVWITKNQLHISVISSPLKKELQMNRLNILERINKEIGSEKLTEIKLY